MLTIHQKHAILAVLRLAVLRQAERWDAERQIELIAERESYIKSLAVSVDDPDHKTAADFIGLAEVETLLKDYEHE